jgi:O-antigen biosynthesis protein
MEYTDERMIPGVSPIGLEAEHRTRYNFAKSLTKLTDIILDAPCGTGYGSAILAEKTLAVDGIDISREAIDFAKEKFSSNKIRFSIQDISQRLPYKDNHFDMITSFEGIEHINNQEGFIRECHRVLKPNGFLFLSTPNADISFSGNEYHVKELTKRELAEMLSAFSEVTWYGQCNRNVIIDRIKSVYWPIKKLIIKAPSVQERKHVIYSEINNVNRYHTEITQLKIGIFEPLIMIAVCKK